MDTLSNIFQRTSTTIAVSLTIGILIGWQLSEFSFSSKTKQFRSDHLVAGTPLLAEQVESNRATGPFSANIAAHPDNLTQRSSQTYIEDPHNLLSDNIRSEYHHINQRNELLPPDTHGLAQDPEIVHTLGGVELERHIANNPAYLKALLSSGEQSEDQFIHMMMNLASNSNDYIKEQIRSTALELSYSQDEPTQQRAIVALNFAGGLENMLTRRRIMDAAWEETDPDTQLTIVEGMQATLLPPTDRHEITALLGNMLRSSTSPDVRAAAFNQLADWQNDPQLLSETTAEMLNDEDPFVRTSVIYSLSTKTLTDENKSALFNIVENNREDMMVRLGAADVLAGASLDDYQYGVVKALLKSGTLDSL